MQTAENPRAVAGANNPPSPLFAEATERTAAANRWLSERSDWEKWDAETADKANFFIGQVGATWTALDEQRKDEGRKFKAEQDAKYGDPLSLLVLAKEKLVPLRRKWLQREEDKIEQQRRKAAAEAEAARVAAEKAAAAAAKPKASLEAELAAAKAQDAAAQAQERAESVPDRATIKGAYTSKATGLRTVWSARITNLGDALRSYKKDPIVVNAIEEAILRVAKRDAIAAKDAARAPKGIEFVSERV